MEKSFFSSSLICVLCLQRCSVWAGEILPAERGQCQGGGSAGQLHVLHEAAAHSTGGAASHALPLSGIKAR